MPRASVLTATCLGMTGTKFGFFFALRHRQCEPARGYRRQARRSCILPVGRCATRPLDYRRYRWSTPWAAKYRRGLLDLEVIQCGYCSRGNHGRQRPWPHDAQFRMIPISTPRWLEISRAFAALMFAIRAAIKQLLPNVNAGVLSWPFDADLSNRFSRRSLLTWWSVAGCVLFGRSTHVRCVR